jgi:hypothetical protein
MKPLQLVASNVADSDYTSRETRPCQQKRVDMSMSMSMLWSLLLRGQGKDAGRVAQRCARAGVADAHVRARHTPT